MSAYVYLCVCAHGDEWVCMCRACLVLRYRRFSTAHIWACPPSEGDDYIFHCHPSEQKIPKPKRLVEWYRNMLERGKDQGVVHSYMVGKHPMHADVWEVVMVSGVRQVPLDSSPHCCLAPNCSKGCCGCSSSASLPSCSGTVRQPPLYCVNLVGLCSSAETGILVIWISLSESSI